MRHRPSPHPLPAGIPAAAASLLLAILAVTLPGTPARAQMIPVDDYREIQVAASLGGQQSGPTSLKPGFFAPFNEYLEALVEGEEAGNASAFADQISEFFPAAIYASGTSSGQWQVVEGAYSALSLFGMQFRVDTCITYTLDATVYPGEPESSGFIELSGPGPNLTYHHVDAGQHTLTGRLSPGTYTLEAFSTVGYSAPSTAGPTYAIVWLCGYCPSPLIVRSPSDTGLTCHTPMTLSVIPKSPAGNLTFQWRFNMVPLTDGSGISGATTSTLTLNNPCVADTGYYDVVVSDGSIVEPSRVAHVTLASLLGVVVAPGDRLLALEGAAPNPSTTTTSFRYAAARPVMMTAAVYDAAGRQVRPLGSRLVNGAGVLQWDGLNGSGEPLGAGIYFMRVQVDGEAHVRRFVRLR